MEPSKAALNVIKNLKVEEKAEYFEKISEMFFDKNFGTTSKSEIELYMFSIYMDTLIKSNSNSDDVLNYNACSDYLMGKSLGIPQEKVRNLKIKKQARYPREFDWEKSLISLKDRIVYDETKRKVIIPVPDPNLYNEIRNFIEEKGGYIEIQRGNNCIQIRPEYLFILLYQNEDEKEKEKLRQKFVEKLREKNEKANIDSIKTDKELSDYALELGENAFEILFDVADGLNNPFSLIMKAIKTINKVIKNNL